MSTMRRVRARVHAPASCLAPVTAVLDLAGLRPSSRADVALLVTDRDDPTEADQWSVDSLPHTVVRLGRESLRVGPFVQPGVTACLRCPAVAGAPGAERPAAYADLDPAPVMMALARAVRDPVTWQAGELPTTWSSTVTLGTDLRPEVTQWPRHPHCGCSWGASLGVG
ncbi:hypothetical protein [Nocardioides sp. B-3]|uniref:hypothetical protein n=1 Tax=Nocardioides sp. B-3 TaxID=2895565 RepID=UPI00215381F9|nr:hypothetical protein [Nocardioides sp. B-3]UUZ58187.1 hypothetical protein LP418_18235 [Nocardioides sp. B-3]